MFKLYELTEQYKKALDSIFDEESPTLQLIDDIKESFENKVINCVKYLKNLEAEHAAIKREIDNMSLRYKSIGKKVDSFSDYIAMNINETGLLDAIKCPEFSVKMQENPESVEIYNEDIISGAYISTKEVKSVNKDLIKKDIKEGFEVPGARLIRRKRLVIK